MSSWSKQLVNLRQSSEERRVKYRLVCALGTSPSWARRYRDWRWDKIARRFGYRDFKEMKEVLE